MKKAYQKRASTTSFICLSVPPGNTPYNNWPARFSSLMGRLTYLVPCRGSVRPIPPLSRPYFPSLPSMWQKWSTRRYSSQENLRESVDVAEYLFTRLYQIGIRSVHGVPGDYNLAALDYLPNANLAWVGNVNELNAGRLSRLFQNAFTFVLCN